MTPRTEAYRLVCSVLLGAALGGYYGFLRPLRPRRTALSDVLFSLGAGWVWLFHSFYLCRGDIRVGYLFGLFFGAVLWELTAGRWLRPLFGMIWKKLGAVWKLLGIPWKKFLQKTKTALLALGGLCKSLQKDM